ncbi:MAG: alpha/beta fold hydrolase [Alphaproteobacteria bacterium]|nr:alpha/beta fold hydrolase [Alphaproteobacteria bacterium]
MSDLKLNHIRAGTGAPPVVFVHGFLCRHQDWRHQVSHFSARHAVLACDLRGHGATPQGEAPMTIETVGGDVAALLEEQGIEGAILVGHSMGCRVVMEARRQAPDRVAGLILVDGSRVGVDRLVGERAFDETIAMNGYGTVVRGLFESMFFDDPPDWKDETLKKVLAVPETTGRPLFRALIAWDAEKLEPAMAEINVPVLVVQSTTMDLDRKRRPLKNGESGPFQDLILAHIVDAESKTISGPGHFCMTEAPAAINAEIERFIAARF